MERREVCLVAYNVSPRIDCAVPGGWLAPIGDPLGAVINTTLYPVGKTRGSITTPLAVGATVVTKTLMGAMGLEDRGERIEKEEEKEQRDEARREKKDATTS